MQHQQIGTLFSQQRLNGYRSIQEHEENFRLITAIARKIGILEVVIRNKIDTILSNRQSQWIILLLGYGFRSLKASDVLAQQSLGVWVKVVEHYKIADCVFEQAFLDTLDFRKYYIKNPKKFPNSHIMRWQKGIVLLKLLHLLRNRAFHFENLYKMNNNGPRLSITICNNSNHKLIFSLEPTNIEQFLNDLLTSFDVDLVNYGK